MARGNHETINMNKMYGFEGEVKAKYALPPAPLAHVLQWGDGIACHCGCFVGPGVSLMRGVLMACVQVYAAVCRLFHGHFQFSAARPRHRRARPGAM